MKLVIIAALTLAAFVASISAHAVSRVPIPWNPNPSTTAQCGGGTNTNTPTMTLVAGQPFTVTWEVVAGDGAGPVTFKVDPAGGVNFGTGSTTIQMTGNPQVPPAVGTYKFTGTAPAVTCTGTGATCTLQIATTNWFSCATIQILDPNSSAAKTTPTPTSPQTCMVAKGLTFCTWMNGQSVALPQGQISALTMDWAVQATYQQYLANKNVFTNPTNPQCAGWYQKFLCGANFQPCGSTFGSGGCNQACVNTNAFCGINPSHLTLYNCTNYPNTGYDLTGNCNGAGSLKISAVVMIASVLLSVLAYML